MCRLLYTILQSFLSPMSLCYLHVQEDIFTIACVNLGRLNKVKVWHDNSGLKSAWNLDRIEVYDKLAEDNFLFPCNRWLATNEDDGQICRELVVVDERALKLERKRTLSRKRSSVSNVDGVDLEAKGLLQLCRTSLVQRMIVLKLWRIESHS